MKTPSHFPLVVSLILLFAFGCSSSGPATASKEKPPRVYSSLLDMLREQPQLNITGAGNSVQIRIRGSRSLVGENEPLFVLDGAPIGNGYSSASSVDVNIVESIRVLAGTQASVYGMRGANGVVLIKTK